MLRAAGTPAKSPLGFEIGLDQQDAARRHALADQRHAPPVKIMEEEDRIKNAEIRPRLLQIQFQPGDPRPLALGQAAGFRQPDGVLVHRQDKGAGLGRGQAVAPGAAGQVQNPAAGTDQAPVPLEPAAGLSTVRR